LARSLGVEDKVLFTGFMADLSCFWQAIDVFVLSSFWEGFGFVLLEAMLARKPVLAFAVSNIPELVADGENGYLFPLPQGEETHVPDAIAAAALRETSTVAPGEGQAGGTEPGSGIAEWGGAFPENMAEALVHLAAEPGRAKAMGETGRAFALAEFSQAACMDRLEELLR
jgi:glycosyltransferase involved in cell wall biosynthesis